MFFLKKTAIFGNISTCSVGRNGTVRACGVKSGEEACVAGTVHLCQAAACSPQLGVNDVPVQGRLYCFWPKAFCRNNFVTCCQGSFCPRLRQKNKEQKWASLYLIPIFPKRPGRGSRCDLPGRRGHGEGDVQPHLGQAASPAPSSCQTDPHPALHTGRAHFRHRAFAQLSPLLGKHFLHGWLLTRPLFSAQTSPLPEGLPPFILCPVT